MIAGRSRLGKGCFLRPAGDYVVTTTVEHVLDGRVPRAVAELSKGGRGRPKGTSFDTELDEMARRVAAGERKHPVAYDIALRQTGASPQNRADHLVDLYNARQSGK